MVLLVLWSCALALVEPGSTIRKLIMSKKTNHDLAVKCVELAIEVAKIVNKILVLFGTAINYYPPHESKMGLKI